MFSRREREERISETSIIALSLQNLIKEPYHTQGWNNCACPHWLLPLIRHPLSSPLRLHPQTLPRTILFPPHPHMLPMEPIMDLISTDWMVYWISLIWGVLMMPLSLWVLFTTQLKMHCRGRRDICWRRLQLREVLTQFQPHQISHFWTRLSGPSMSCWGGYRGWGVLTWRNSNRLKRENNGWWEAFDKVIGYERLFKTQYKGAEGTVEIVWAYAWWKDKDYHAQEGQQRRATISEWKKYIRNKKINDWFYHKDKSVEPGSGIIYIVPLLTLQKLKCITFTARKRAGHTSCHVSGGSGRVTSCPLFPKVVKLFYWLTNIHGRTTRRVSCPNILLFIQFMFYMFYDAFWWSVRTYDINFLFHIIPCSLDYSNFYYVYTLIISHPRWYCSFKILFWSSVIFSHAYYYISSDYFLFQFNWYVEVQIFIQNIS